MTSALRLRQLGHSLLRGASWQHPTVQRLLPLADRTDAARRTRLGLDSLPPFSLRIRSNGVDRQLGGVSFFRLSRVLVADLETNACLAADSDVLEIGCGVGRVALALRERQPNLSYTGLDIDEVSVRACLENECLRGPTYRFQHVDVASELYNAAGTLSATEFTLPFADASLDVVFLVSVFTHLLPQECAAYAREIMRVLRTDGTCAVTSILLPDVAPAVHGGWAVDGDLLSRYPRIPRKMIGHTVTMLAGWFGTQPDVVVRAASGEAPCLDEAAPRHDFAQAMLVLRKRDGNGALLGPGFKMLARIRRQQRINVPGELLPNRWR